MPFFFTTTSSSSSSSSSSSRPGAGFAAFTRDPRRPPPPSPRRQFVRTLRSATTNTATTTTTTTTLPAPVHETVASVQDVVGSRWKQRTRSGGTRSTIRRIIISSSSLTFLLFGAAVFEVVNVRYLALQSVSSSSLYLAVTSPALWLPQFTTTSTTLKTATTTTAKSSSAQETTDEHTRKMMLTLLLFAMTPGPMVSSLEQTSATITKTTTTTTSASASASGLSLSTFSSQQERVVHRTQLEWPVLEEYAMEYPEFLLSEPNFLDPAHQRDFYKHRPPDEWYTLPPKARQGFITVVHNGVYNRRDDCGFRGDYRLHFPTKIDTRVQHPYMPGKVVALDDKAAEDFPHFMQSGMPKLVQAKHYLDVNPDAMIMAHFAKNDRIMKLVRRLGIQNQVVPWKDPLAAEELVLVCHAPPIHPVLWQRARALLGVKPDVVGTKVIWVVRNRSNSHHGRICINDEQVQAYLRERFQADFVSFDPSRYDLDETMEIFQQARVVLGVHGGGLYNIIFAPATATVVEFMPTSSRGEPKAASHLMVWLFAVMQQQVYWQIPQMVNRWSKLIRGGDNISVDLAQLAQVLDTIFASSPSLSTTTINAPRVNAEVPPAEPTETRKVTIHTKTNEAAPVNAVTRQVTTTNSSSSSTVIVTHRTMLEWPLVEEYAIEYPEFPLTDPNFLDPSHQRDFFQHRPPDEWYNLPPVARQGFITVVEKGLYNRRDDCGFRGDYRMHLPASKDNTPFQYMPGKVVALDDRPAQDFQHFMDSGMIKLIQAKPYLDANPDAIIMAHFAHNGRIMELVRRLGIQHTVRAWQDPLAAEQLVLVCRAPPIHPVLWERARALLGVQTDVVGTKIIWVVRNRSNAHNGRICVNDDQVQAYLRERFGPDFVSFDPSQHGLDETMQIFQQARVVLGLHGGGLYNIIFAPATATVVEFMPTSSEGRPQAASYLIFWLFAVMHQQVYWRIPQLVDNSAGIRDSISVDLSQLAQVLDNIFGSSSSSTTSSLRSPYTTVGVNISLPEKLTKLQLAASSSTQQPPLSTKSNDAAPANALMMISSATTSSSQEIVTHRTMLEWPVLEEYAIEYPEFNLPEPHFLDPSHKDDFFQRRPTDEWYTLPPEARQGLITVVHKGVYNRRDECGFRSDYRMHFLGSDNNTLYEYMPGKVVALDDVPAQNFQQFMNSGIPKLVQAKYYLDVNPDAIIMAHFANNDRIMEIVRRLGLNHRVVPWQDPLAAEELVLVCRAPPVHPVLSQRASALLGVQTDKVGTKVIWVVQNRSNAHNGHICINDEQVQAYLRERFGADFVSFDPNRYSLDETMQMFQQARVVLGVHDGGLYNIMFAPATATIVEFMPTSARGEPKTASYWIFWLLAVMHQQVYWRVPQLVGNSAGVGESISVDLVQLAQVLDNIFASSSSSSSSTTSSLGATAAAPPFAMAGVDATITEKHTDLQPAASSTHQPPSSTKSTEAAGNAPMISVATTSSSKEIVTHRTMLEWPVLEEFAIEYPEFPLIKPNFLDPAHERDFFKHRPPDEWYTLPPEARQGSITIVHKGLYNRRDDCGFRSDYRMHLLGSDNTLYEYMPGKVVALDDAPAKDFQHFMDSGMPKLVQAKHYLDLNPDAIIMAHFANNDRIMEIVRRLGVINRVVPWQDPLAAEELVLVCRAPPIHPVLWQRAREIMGVQTDKVGSKVIWVTRNPSNVHNGRICINDKQVQAYLRERFGADFVSFDPSELTLNETMQMFQQAHVVLGLHGGGLYNILFAPATATIVEFMPTTPEGVPRAASHLMFWLFAVMHQQVYWRIPQVVDDSAQAGARDSISVDLTQLAQVLDRILNSSPTANA